MCLRQDPVTTKAAVRVRAQIALFGTELIAHNPLVSDIQNEPYLRRMSNDWRDSAWPVFGSPRHLSLSAITRLTGEGSDR
jgi:hypothetical protein